MARDDASTLCHGFGVCAGWACVKVRIRLRHETNNTRLETNNKRQKTKNKDERQIQNVTDEDKEKDEDKDKRQKRNKKNNRQITKDKRKITNA